MGARMGGRMIRNALLASAAMGCAILAATPSLAQERRTFDIPAESASDAIRALARQSGLQVLAPAEDVRGVRTNAVQGAFDPMDAVHRLVDGTGLEVVQTGPNTVTIRRPNGAAPQAAVRASSEGDTTAVEEVTVTGSRIKRAGFDTLEAAFQTDSKTIQQRSYTNVIQALDETPGFAASGVNPVGTNQTTFGSGQSFADFFGLGSNRTLTLVNGRRFVTSNTPAGGNASNPGGAGMQVDLNVIPVGLVDHIETVAIGGAPVYGSDAIAGTVNIILKDHFNGLEATAQYGVTDHGDGESQTYRVLAGGDFAEGRGNAVISAEYAKQDGMLLSARSGAYHAFADPTGGPPALFVAKDLVIGGMTEGGLPFQVIAPGYPFPDPNGDYIRDGNGTPLQFGPKGTLIPFHPGVSVLGLPFPAEEDGGDGTRFADHLGLLAPTSRVLLNGIAHYDVRPNVRAFIETSYAHSQGEEISDLAAFVSPVVGGNTMSFSIDNPFLDPTTRATLVANGVTNSFQMARNFSDLLETDGYLERTTVDLYRVVAGFQGDFQLGGQKWSWDASYNYGRSEGLTNFNYINDNRLALAMDAVRDANGNIVCRSGGNCVPIDLFGVNRFSKEAADYVLDPVQAQSINTEKVITADLAGDLPFGISPQHIAVNIGAEYREEHGAFNPDAAAMAGTSLFGLSLAGPYDGIAGGFNTKEIYGETVVPIVVPEQNMSFVRSLSFEGAVRYVDNSINGGATTWKAGGRFSPNLGDWSEGLVLRGVYTHAIRAPAVSELFSGASSTRGSVADPCDASRYQTGNNPTVRAANCATALAALGYTTPADFHSTTTALSPLGTVSGNPNLDNETANSWSVGFVYQPRILPRFRLSADWSDIKLEGGIQSLSINQMLTACYDSPNYPNDPACQASVFQRLNAGQVGAGSPNPTRVAGDIANGYNTGFINTASLEFAGLIVASEYGFDLSSLNSGWADAGSLRFGAKVFYTDKYDTVAFPGQPVIHSKGNVGTPEFSGQFSADWTWKNLDVYLQGLWTSSTKIDNTLDNATLSDHFNNVGSYWKFNGSVGYQVTPEVRAQVTVNNIFDKKLSDAQLFSGSYGTYDLIGRRYVFSLTATF